tara:strand:- start:222 stop:446 length:225 start_codon:yes stop_codon:yes gene_type:complete
MWSELKYVKVEYLPNRFMTSIQGKKNGNLCAIPCDELNNDYINIMKLVDAGELTIEGTGGKYQCFEDLTIKDET